MSVLPEEQGSARHSPESVLALSMTHKMTDKLEQQMTDPDRPSQLSTTITMTTVLPIRIKAESEKTPDIEQALPKTSPLPNQKESSSPQSDLATTEIPLTAKPPKQFQEIFIIPKKHLGPISPLEKQPPRAKRAREDDETDVSPETAQKRLRITKERAPLAERDGNARDSTAGENSEKEAVRLVGQITRVLKNSNQEDLLRSVNFGHRRLERTILHQGPHGHIWKYVFDDAKGVETVCVAKEYDGKSTSDFQRELNAYREMWSYPKLDAHVPQFLNYSESRRKMFIGLIKGRPYNECAGFSQHLRIQVARAVKGIALLLLKFGVAHGRIETENVMIRDGIETCAEDRTHKYVVLVGYSDAVLKKRSTPEAWTIAQKHVLRGVANFGAGDLRGRIR